MLEEIWRGLERFEHVEIPFGLERLDRVIIQDTLMSVLLRNVRLQAAKWDRKVRIPCPEMTKPKMMPSTISIHFVYSNWIDVL